MNKYIKQFEKNNKLACKNYLREKNFLILDRGRPAQIFYSSLFGISINKKKKFNVFVLSDKKVNRQYNKFFYKSFGIDNFSYLTFSFKNFIFIHSFLLTILSILRINFLGFDWFVKNFKINKVYCGDLIWDKYIRNDLSFLKKKIDFKLIKILYISIYKFLFLEKYIKDNNIKTILGCTNNYISISAFALRIGLKYKIKTFQQKIYNISEITKIADACKNTYTLSKTELINKYRNTKNNIFEDYLRQRLNGTKLPKNITESVDVFRAYYKKKNDKKYLFKTLKVNIRNYDQICIFAPHAFADCNHGLGHFIFRDYYQHFTQTIEMIKPDSKNLWIVKPHPGTFYYGENGIITNYIKKIKKKHIVICPDEISTKLILEIADKVVTGRGTIGLEAACFGKKPILAGNALYSDLGITHNPKNSNEYKKLLLSPKKNIKLSKNQINTAKKLIFWFGKGKMNNKTNIVSSTNTIKNSFFKNLLQLQKKQNFDKKIDEYLNYVNKFI